MRRALPGLLLGCLTLGIGSIALAGDNDQAGIALHVTTTPAINCAGALALTPATLSTASAGPAGQSYGVWVLVCNGSDSTGIGGAQFGIDITGGPAAGLGGTAFGWLLCADLDFPSGTWPASGSDNLVTYNTVTNCQDVNSLPFVPKTVIAMLGQLYIYDYAGGGSIAITPSPRSGGTAKVADCASSETVIDPPPGPPSHLGLAAINGGHGYSPCSTPPTPVESTTWGRIKSLGD